LIGSTPTIKDASAIEFEWLQSDQRRFFVPCPEPECGHEQVLVWQSVRWNKSPDGEHDPSTAHYMCESCGGLWNDTQRHNAVHRGRWVAERPFHGVAGFHISALLSPWITLPQVVAEFLQVRHDPTRLQTWVNCVLGETWEQRAEKVDASNFMARRENYGPHSLPEGVLRLTAGCDIQGDRIEMIIVGWGKHDESWAVSYHVIPGSPTQLDVWNTLDELLAEPFHTEDGRELRIKETCIDSGGHHAAEVLTFCKPRLRRRVFAIKGAAGPRPIWPHRATRTKRHEFVYTIGVDTAKDTLYGRLRISSPGEHRAYVHFPIADVFDQKFFDQLVSEQVEMRRKEGRPYRVWVLPSGKRNEALDCFVYAMAARASRPGKLYPPPSSAPRPALNPEVVNIQVDPAQVTQPQVQVIGPGAHRYGDPQPPTRQPIWKKLAF
jgi:phage terminase large subunit GpA-like protein